MSLRLALLGLALLLALPGLVAVIGAMPPFGAASSPYGAAVNALGPELRNVSNMIAAVNFDFRGIDTLGEEFMMVAAVTGTVILLRGTRGEGERDRAGRLPGRALEERAEAVVATCRVLAGAILLFGLYVTLHGTVTPGGGFQGGVIIASSLPVLYLGEGYAAWRRLTKSPVLAALEGGGAFVFALAALLPLAGGHAALTNLLPLGTYKDLFSGGLMLVGNHAVALAVAGGFGMMLLEFMEETRVAGDDPPPEDEDR
ncbi:MnhB domain-containing protein [Aureimonas endophytica]|uniref:MnhB domain-containing protein n=1 Tax=Aureimonas endophytica TaxID=2027858 RepID=UPI001FCEE4E7|nr:MnhB domain-containing protein [Aureimonas endophytica]